MTLRYVHLSTEFGRNGIERLADLTEDATEMSPGQVSVDAQGAKDNAKLLKSVEGGMVSNPQPSALFTDRCTLQLFRDFHE